jgi:prepilin-type N-terminal cleavage/methylation domain-containing protein
MSTNKQILAKIRQAGFTLVELAVAIFIIGMIASMAIGAINAQIMNAYIRTTQSNQGAIKDALIAYIAKNKRLPCPAVDTTGAEGRQMASLPSNCMTYYGLVPYTELGLSKTVAMDGWNNFFSYGVSWQWTATYNAIPPDNHSTSNSALSFNVGVPGIVTVNDRDQASGNPITISSNAAAIIVSQGSDGYGAYTPKGTIMDSTNAGADEILNIPPTSFASSVAATTPILGPFYKRDFTNSTTASHGAFDDIVLVINSGDLLTPLIKDGALQSAQSQYAALVLAIQDWVAANIPPAAASAPCAAPTLASMPTNLTVDPWGNKLGSGTTPFTYIPGPALFSSGVPAATTFQLYNSTPSAMPQSAVISAGSLMRIYPFLLNNGC